MKVRGLLLLVKERKMAGHSEQDRKLCYLRDTAIILLYLDTGIRLREQTDILLSDIDLPMNTVNVMGKNAEERTVSV